MRTGPLSWEAWPSNQTADWGVRRPHTLQRSTTPPRALADTMLGETVQPTPDMHRRCHAIIDQLQVPPPADVPSMIRAARQLRRRPIDLHHLPHGLGDLTGLLLDNGQRVEIWVVPDAPAAHARHIVAHELGHLLLGHRLRPVASGPPGGVGSVPALLCRMSAREDTGTIADAIAGSHPGASTEVEAELFATLLCTAPPPAPLELPDGSGPVDVLWRQEELFRPRRTIARA